MSDHAFALQVDSIALVQKRVYLRHFASWQVRTGRCTRACVALACRLEYVHERASERALASARLLITWIASRWVPVLRYSAHMHA